MKNASNKQYVSKKFMEQYVIEKNQRRQSALLSNDVQQLIEQVNVMQGEMIQKQEANLQIHQNLILPQNNDINNNNNIIIKEEEQEYDSMAEDLDSDDLGDNLSDKEEQKIQIEKQIPQKIMPKKAEARKQSPLALAPLGKVDKKQTVVASKPSAQQNQVRGGGFKSTSSSVSSSKQKAAIPQLGKKEAIQKSSMIPVKKEEAKNSLQIKPLNAVNQANEMSKPLFINQTKLKKEPGHKGKYRKEVDTNVFNIQLKILKDQAELATGDPIFCKSCQAILNKYSKLSEAEEKEENKENEEPNQQWICEFCNFKNKINVEPEELPKSEGVNYILEAAAQINDKQNKQIKTEISVIFCLDISGSMCVSQPINGLHQIKGDRMVGIKKDLMKFSDGSDQRLNNEQRNVTYVSRMQCVQSAIDQQLVDNSKVAPDRKIGLVTFNSDVTIIGDGLKEPQVIAGDKLKDYEYLLQNAIANEKTYLSQPIKKTYSKLQQKLMSIEETGPTALGPALLSSIAIASQGAPGSTVILCTDGLANIGLGAFDEVVSEKESEETEKFYESLAKLAQENGVVVSIISIEGEECNLDTLSKISEVTGGDVQRVKPEELINNFNDIMSVPLIATNVQLKVKLHKGLEFRNENPFNINEDRTIMARDLGNVNEETEVTFEYKLKNLQDLLNMDDLDLTVIKQFPFQAQITYTSLFDKSRCIRVITHTLEASDNKEELELNANYEVLGMNAIQQSAKLAKNGDYKSAALNAKAWDNRLKTKIKNNNQAAVYSNFRNHMDDIYSKMNMQMQLEKIEENEVKSSFKQGGAQQKMKKQKVSDAVSNALYKGSKMNSKVLNKKSQ